jgi:GMP synthase (glutamine-hydrolysing)
MHSDIRTRTVLVIQPDKEDPLDLFAGHFRTAGLATHTIRPFDGDKVPSSVDTSALVVLGGDMGANDDRAYPWLRDVKELLRTAVDQAVPTLGICLGGQLLAAARGGVVARGAMGSEIGAPRFSARAEAAADPLFGSLHWPRAYATMHRDAITELPPDAVWLAESETYPHQAFRVGSAAWGLQFHPEVSLTRFLRWAEYIEGDAETQRRINRGAAEFAVRSRDIDANARGLANAFAQIVLSRAQV